MKFVDDLHFAERNLLSNPLRTMLTVLGVVIGIGSILFFISLGYGLQQITLREITQTDALRIMNVTTGISGALHLDTQGISTIAGIESVESISPILNFSSQVTFRDTTTESILTGINPTFQEIEVGLAQSGENLSDPERPTAVISSTLMNLLGVEVPEGMLGQELNFQLFVPTVEDPNTFHQVDKTFKVVGLVKSTAAAAFVPVSTLFDLPFGEFNALKLRVDERRNFDLVRSKIEVMGYEVDAPADTLNEVNTVFQVVQVVLAFFGLIALFVAAIGMFNTMTISLLERTHEIGILKAIGATHGDIRRLFLIESLMIALLGGILGVIAAMGLGELVNLGISYLARNLGGEVVEVFATPWQFVLMMIGIALLLGFITGVYPARRASRLDALQALRYE